MRICSSPSTSSSIFFFFLLPEEDERRQKAALLSRGAEPKRPEVPATSVQPVQVNHTTWADEARAEAHNRQPRPPAPAPAAPPRLPPPTPITVIPIPVVPANPLQSALHTASPIPVVTPLATALSAPGTPLLSSVVKDTQSPPQQQQQHLHQLQHRSLVTHVKAEGSTLPQSGTSPKQQPQALLQPYPPTPVITSQHALLAQPTLAPPQGHVPQPVRPNGAALEDTRALEGKRRPGG